MTGCPERETNYKTLKAYILEHGYLPDKKKVQLFNDRLLLVGINYDKKSKVHECKIERCGESLSQSLSKHELVTKLSLSLEQVDLMLDSLQVPVLSKELHSLMGFKDPTYFKRNIIDVLLKDGLRFLPEIAGC